MSSFQNHPFRIFYSQADDPQRNFYIPALSASVRYERSAGFFNSSALAVAAEGVARLIQNDGNMRLLVGAELDEDDVQAIRQGYDLKERISERLLEHFSDPIDALMRKRLEVLAWMLAEGTLEIREVLPKDEKGHPIPAAFAVFVSGCERHRPTPFSTRWCGVWWPERGVALALPPSPILGEGPGVRAFIRQAPLGLPKDPAGGTLTALSQALDIPLFHFGNYIH